MNAATKAIIGVAIIVIAGAAVYYGIFSFGADKMEEYGVQDLIEEQGYTVDSIFHPVLQHRGGWQHLSHLRRLRRRPERPSLLRRHLRCRYEGAHQ